MNAAIEDKTEMVYPEMTGSLADRFQTALKSDFLTDVTFMVGPSRLLRKAHSYVLAMFSEVFWVMFYGSLSGNLKENAVCIPDVDIVAFDGMIQFAYARRINFSSIKEAIDIAYTAKKYMVHELLQAAADYLQKCRSVDTIGEIYRTAILLDLQQLKESCEIFVSYHGAEILESESFVFLPDNVILSVVSGMSGFIHGGILFRSLIKWALNQLPFELMEAGPSETTDTKASCLRKLVFPFLPFVRFLSLSTKDLLETVRGDAEGILDRDEILAVICNIEGVLDVPLPDWCNRSRTVAKAPKVVRKQGRSPKKLAINSAYKRRLRSSSSSKELRY